jgi:hypothetical protein
MNTFEYYFNKLRPTQQEMHKSYIKYYKTLNVTQKNKTFQLIIDRVLTEAEDRFMYINVLKLISI